MNNKMTTNSQLSTTEPKKRKTMKTKTKQTTRTGTESDITWRVFSGEGRGTRRGRNVQGIRSIIGRHKIDWERLRVIKETEVKEFICTPMNMN